MDGTVAGLRTGRLYGFLFIPIFFLVLLGILRNIYIYNFGTRGIGPLNWADVAGEATGVMWWSSLMWGLAALLCLLEFDRNTTRLRSYWLAISIGSLLLSLDESVQIHERFSAPAGWLFNNPGGFFAAWWVLAAIPIVAICFILLIPFLLALPRKTATGLIMAGAIFLLGAVGFEMVFARVITSDPDATTMLWTLMTIEETLEMIGIALFCITVHGHINRQQQAGTSQS
ncbi:MAG: hypothetical protein KF810_02370 [Rhizobiaceae bacterium]|nr:hypothetical protein [Rhizobiaceae bacterium]